MEVKQIYNIINNVTNEVLGKTDLVQEDLSNIVDVGNELFDTSSVDHYVKSLVNHIGKVVFVDRPYIGNVPSLVMDSWEYGSVLEKISADLPVASENSEWELEDGQSYDTNVFYKPSISAKFFNKKVTFEIPMSFTEKQVKESFSNVNQLNGFISMIYNAVDKAMTVRIDNLIMRTINNMIGETVYSDLYDKSAKKVVLANSGMKAVNLLKLYNEKFNTSLTAVECVTNSDFIRFASYMMSLYVDRLSKISTLFNVGGKERFTSGEYLHTVMLSEFKASATAYLQSDTFHDNYVALPNSESVPYWQGSGTSYSFADTSKVTVKTAGGNVVEITGVLAIMFDKDSMGVCNLEKRVTTNYNAKAEFFNNYYKFEAGYFNDLNENFVVFFVA